MASPKRRNRTAVEVPPAEAPDETQDAGPKACPSKILFDLGSDLHERLVAAMARMQALQPYLRPNKSAMMRDFAAHGLDALEKRLAADERSLAARAARARAE